MEVRSEVVEEGVVSITESLSRMNLRSPVCQPDRPTRVSIYAYSDSVLLVDHITNIT